MAREYDNKDKKNSLVEHLKTAGLLAITAGAGIAAIRYGQGKVFKKAVQEAASLPKGSNIYNLAKTAVKNYSPKKVPIPKAIGYLVGETSIGKKIEGISKTNMPMTVLEKIFTLRDLRDIGRAPAFKKLSKEAIDEADGDIFYALGSLFEKDKAGRFIEKQKGGFLYAVSPNSPSMLQKVDNIRKSTLSSIENIDDKLARLYREAKQYPAKRANIFKRIEGLKKHKEGLEKLSEPIPGIFEDPKEFIKRRLSLGEFRQYGTYEDEAKEFIDNIKSFFKPHEEEAREILSYKFKKYGSFKESLWDPLVKLSRGRFKEAFRTSPIGVGGKGNKEGTTALNDLIWRSLARMNMQIGRSPAGFFALPEKDIGSLYELGKNTALKRLLPAAVAWHVASYTLFESDQLSGGKGLKTQFGNLWQTTNIGFSQIAQVTGINALSAYARKLSPRKQIGDKKVGMSPEELSEYYEEGKYPVRKGRLWPLSSTPFIGGRIEYFSEPWSTRIKKPSRNKMIYGSEREYWKRSWLPTPRYPLSPINRLLDPYYVERENYRERPYPLTSPMFSSQTPWGPVLNQTIGKVLKPQRRMHVGEDLGDKPPKPKGAYNSMAGTSIGTPVGTYGLGESVLPEDIRQNYYLRFTRSGANDLYHRQMYPGSSSSLNPKYSQGTRRSSVDTPYSEFRPSLASNITIRVSQSGTTITQGSKYAKGPESIEDASIGDRYRSFNDFRYNMKLAQGNFYYNKFREARPEPLGVKELRPANPQSLGYNATQAYYNWSRIFGIYGFIGGTLAENAGFLPYTGNKEPVYETAGNITSPSRWYYEDLNVGGIDPTGFAVSEIGRRFLTHEIKTNVAYNRIPNNMPSWLPGENYYKSFRTGDPYAKLPNGEYRLPGKLYEEVNDIDIFKMGVGPSVLSRSSEDLYRYLTDQEFAASLEAERAMEKGTALHKKIEEDLEQEGVISESEYEFRDKKRNIHGFVDAIGPNGEPIEIKTVNPHKFADIARSKSASEEHINQLQLYMSQLNKDRGRIIYANAENQNQKILIDVKANEMRTKMMYDKLRRVRKQVKAHVESGVVPRGNLYKDIERLKILGDVAPWSREYYGMLKKIRNREELSEEEHEELRKTVKRTSAVRKKYDFVPYRYSGIKTEKRNVIIEKMLDPTTFYVRGEKNPYRLEGVNIKGEKKEEALEYLAKTFKEGSKVEVEFSADPMNKISRDTYRTKRSIMRVGGKDIGRELVKKGLAEEDTKESEISTIARTNIFERKFMGGIENLLHLPIPVLHTKIVPWDSPLEYYKRQRVFAPEWREWSKPYAHHIKPTVHSLGAEGALKGGMMGGILGAMLANKGYRGKGAAVGAAVIGTSTLFQGAMSRTKGKRWVPKRTEKERDIKEYFDRLKYIKYKKLYNKSRSVVKRRFGYDIEDKISKIEKAGKERVRLSDELLKEERKQARLFGSKNSAKIKEINAKIRKLNKISGITELSPLEATSYMYRKKMNQTMFGADPYGPMKDVMAALPRDEKTFFTEFVKAPQKEREEIYEVAPDYMKKFLAPYYGMKAPELEGMSEYFSKHFLPAPDWEGWDEENNLEGYKLQTAKSQGFKPESLGFFQEEQIRYQNVASLPMTQKGSSYSGIDHKVANMIDSVGLQNVNMRVLRVPADSNSLDLNININSNRSSEIENLIGEYI